MPDDYRDALLGPPHPALDLDAIRARRAAITPGTWTTEGKRSDYNANYVWYRTEDAIGQICMITGAGTDADAAFIAAAPADIDALLARVTDLETTLATLRAGYAGRRDYAEEQAQHAAARGDFQGVAYWSGAQAVWAELVQHSMP